jgi:hypothetical protein
VERRVRLLVVPDFAGRGQTLFAEGWLLSLQHPARRSESLHYTILQPSVLPGKGPAVIRFPRTFTGDLVGLKSAVVYAVMRYIHGIARVVVLLGRIAGTFIVA